MQQLFTIARNTFLESIRQPVYLVLLFVGTLLLLLLNPQFAAFTLEHGRGDNKMLIDMGYSTLFLCCIFLAAFTAAGVLTRELDNRTVLTVISKPVSRSAFVIAKFFGVAAAIAVSYYVLSLIFIISMRQGVMQTASVRIDWPLWLITLGAIMVAVAVATWGNIAYQWVFTSSAVLALTFGLSLALSLILFINKNWQFQSPVTDFLAYDAELAKIVLGLIMVFQAVLIITAVAVACSTRLGQIMTLLVCFGLYGMGLISNSFSLLVHKQLSIPQDTGFISSMAAVYHSSEPINVKIIMAAAKLLYLILPNLQFFWPADAITQKHELPLSHIGTVSVYAVVYITLVMCIAVIMFQRREVS